MDSYIYLILVLCRVGFAIASYYGIGSVFFWILSIFLPKYLNIFDENLLNILIRIFFGAFIFSIFIVILLLTGGLSDQVILLVKVLGGVAAAVQALMFLRSPASPDFSRTVPLALMFIVALGLVAFSSLDTPIPHPDAEQYHLALPWMFSVADGLVYESSLHQLGIYMGYDLLYLTIGDLKTLLERPELMASLRAFNALSSLTLFAGVYYLAKAFGLSRSLAVVAALTLLTLGPVSTYWAHLKNDLIVAAVALFSLAILFQAWTQLSPLKLVLASMLAAFSITIKISVLVPLAIVFTIVFASRRFQIHIVAISVLLGILILLPWLYYAYLLQSAPFYPLVVQQPEEIRAAWAVRDANGLPSDWQTALTMLPSILLDVYPISGNWTLGLPFLFYAALTLLGIVWRTISARAGLAEVIAAAALLWLILFYVDRFDGRFLSRYIIVSCGVIFAYGLLLLQDWCRSAKIGRFFLPGPLVAFASLAIVASVWSTPPIVANLAKAYSVVGQGVRAWHANWVTIYSDWTTFHRAVNEVADGRGVAVNDHFVLFFAGPVINLHGMHARGLNLYRKDGPFIRDLLMSYGIKTLVFRPNISGQTKALKSFIDQCTEPVTSATGPQSGRQILHIKADC